MLLTLTILLLVSPITNAEPYSWYWGGDVTLSQASEYCEEPGISTQCQKACAKNHYQYLSKGIGKGDGQAYCKQVANHYKLWCSCDMANSKDYPGCPLYPLTTPTNTYTLIEGDTQEKCKANCEVYKYSLNTEGMAAGVCMSKGQAVCQCDWVNENQIKIQSKDEESRTTVKIDNL